MANQTLDGSSTPYAIASGTTVTVSDGSTLTLLGSIDNAGVIFDDSTGDMGESMTSPGDFTPIFLDTSQVVLTGSGHLVFSSVAGGTQDPENDIDAGYPLTTATLVNVDNTISGAGGINVLLTNDAQGIVDGNGPASEALSLSEGGANSGTLEATGAGGLYLYGSWNQTGGGTVLASGTGNNVTLSQADIEGGTLTTNGGTISSLNATLDGTSAPVTISAGSTVSTTGYELSLQGTIVNDGMLAFSHADLNGLSQALTLEGGGTVELNSVSVGGPSALVNVNNTLVGYGNIGNGSTLLALTNLASGTIDAINQMAVYATATLDNAGLIESTLGGLLTLINTTIENAGGGTLLANGANTPIGALYAGTIEGTNVALPDGVLETVNGGLIVLDGTRDTLGSATSTPTITAGSFIQVPGSTTLDVLTGTIDNLGTLAIGNTAYYNTSTSDLALSAPVTTLQGGGTLAMMIDFEATNPVNEITSASASLAVLTNVNETIEGAGTIGSASAPVAVTNEASGVIDTSINSAYDPLVIMASGTLRNAGLMESTERASLTFSGGTIANAGGTIAAISDQNESNSGMVTLSGEDVQGGLLLASNNGSNPYEAESGVITFSSTGNTLDGTTSAVMVRGVGTVSIAAAASLDLRGLVSLSGTNFAVNGTLRNDGTLDGNGGIAGTLTNAGVLRADGGTLSVSGEVTGGGSIALAGGSAFDLGGATTQAVDFAGQGGSTLDLSAPASFTGTLRNLASGDTIVLGSVDVASDPTIAGTTLEIPESGGGMLEYQLADFPGGEFVELVSSGSSQSVLQVACFASGTQIAAPDGDIPVEHLRPGKVVTLARGGTAPVVWVGHRRIDCKRHPRPRSVLPLRVHAHVFGPGVPLRDVLLSPDHAICVDNALIPVACLENGETVVRESVDEVTYWHIELAAHDVILADGLPCESYLDTGSRGAFANGGVVELFPDFKTPLSSAGCLPLHVEGPVVEAARRIMLDAGSGGGSGLSDIVCGSLG